ncbi:MAG: sigma-70 family RNA polymerase sigma factor [Lachnospiraceae bacterium]|nr:sigma-70 family RNA polymerase sigma factor [Lachnospiraceae bacterium]
MTVEEINSIYYINKEIEHIQKELYDLKTKNFYKSNILTGMPKGNSEHDIFSDYAEDIKTLEDMLHYNLKKLQTERKKIEKFLSSIEDVELRLIIRLRAVNNMSWEEIGAQLKMDRTTASKKFYKFFRKR